MVVLEDAGFIKDIEKTLELMEKVSGKKLANFELEKMISENKKIRTFNEKDEETKNMTEAVFKLVELKGLYHIKTNEQLYLSFVKLQALAEKNGHGSDFSWGGVFVGTETFLKTRWNSYNKEEKNNNAFQQLNFMKIEYSDKAIPNNMVSNNKNNFFERVYELLYDKENWKKNDGSLYRLEVYFKHLMIKIKDDKDMHKIVSFNKKRNKIIFNSRLMSKFAHYIIVSCNYDNKNFSSFKIVESKKELIEMGFEEDSMEINPVSFFKKIEDVIFTGTIQDFDLYNLKHLNHIIEERKHRLPEEMRNISSIDIAMKLKISIEMGVKMALTDYKFIVPMYNEEKMGIQFLIPVYTSFNGNSKPGCALVIDKNENKWEIKTVLDIETAYGNARLVNRPDQNWLSIE